MRELDGDFAALGVNVRFFTIATPEEAQQFCAKFGDPSRCLADAEMTTYQAMGLESFTLLGFVLDPELKRRRAANNAAGFAQDWKNTKYKNIRQLPGAALVDRDGEVRWIYRGKHPGDLPPMSEMLEAARKRLG